MAWKTWTIKSGDDHATIANFGAVLLDWCVAEPGGNQSTQFAGPVVEDKPQRHLIDGYRSESEARGLDGCRSAVLVPWSNRIREGKFCFQGKDYDLANKVWGGELALHGLLVQAEYQLVSFAEDTLVLGTRVPVLEDYPFELSVEVSYKISSASHQLEFAVVVKNEGETDAPVTIGWHPYLDCEPFGTKQVVVTLPASEHVKTEPNLIPLPGKEAFEQKDLPVVIRDCDSIDDCFTGLKGTNGVFQAIVDYPDGAQLTMNLEGASQSIGCGSFQLFIGQMLELRPGESFAVEPLLTMTDAFNRSECAEVVRVAPSQTQEFKTVLSFSA